MIIMYIFLFQWVCTHILTSWHTHPKLALIHFVLPESMKYHSILQFHVSWYLVTSFSYLNHWQLELVLVSFNNDIIKKIVYLFLLQIYHHFIDNLTQVYLTQGFMFSIIFYIIYSLSTETILLCFEFIQLLLCLKCLQNEWFSI